ncbi:protein-glutamate O-methyltransferase CheR [Baekduia soli]|uniref:protein-glutamate O-methyltransferase n=1 Tax=Baekduia soli TaxID=496014 RepID=A0A5B8U1F1_9ACTN|nr:protein-glutamate O-methyltransferase CheR [Baekduia soli]QEC46849.1 protein-glutamate O-methyltransferase CheR [Baekduia soli]
MTPHAPRGSAIDAVEALAVAVRRPAAEGGRALVSDYEPFCEAVRRLCGIDLLQYKRGQMERRIRSFVATRGAADLTSYTVQLKADKSELERLLDRVTINVSQLWRNPEQWAVLEERILPDLAASAPGGTPRLKAWSAGCSYGAEAYTLAAVARRALGRAQISILGTDIDARMVARARAGVFTADDARAAPTATLAAHFSMVGGAWHAGDDLKRLVRFEEGDLLRVRPAAGSFDLVLCRNTVIYFNEDVRDDLHGRLAHSLRAGGRLVVGATERVSQPARHGLEPESPFVYRKS